VVFDLSTGNIDELKFSFSLDLFFKNGIKHRINFSFNSFNNKSFSFFHTIFKEIIFEFRMVLVGNRPSFIDEFFIFVLDPDLTLSLRIDQHSVSGTVSNHDTILDGQVIFR
jgi:hypothetical protein